MSLSTTTSSQSSTTSFLPSQNLASQELPTTYTIAPSHDNLASLASSSSSTPCFTSSEYLPHEFHTFLLESMERNEWVLQSAENEFNFEKAQFELKQQKAELELKKQTAELERKLQKAELELKLLKAELEIKEIKGKIAEPDLTCRMPQFNPPESWESLGMAKLIDKGWEWLDISKFVDKRWKWLDILKLLGGAMLLVVALSASLTLVMALLLVITIPVDRMLDYWARRA
jgi:hypothetical protein